MSLVCSAVGGCNRIDTLTLGYHKSISSEALTGSRLFPCVYSFVGSLASYLAISDMF